MKKETCLKSTHEKGPEMIKHLGEKVPIQPHIRGQVRHCQSDEEEQTENQYDARIEISLDMQSGRE